MQDVRLDDCKDLMHHFFLRLIRDAVGDADPEEVEQAREFIKNEHLSDGELISPFSFSYLCAFVDLPEEVVKPVIGDLELIGWRKNSIIFKFLMQTLNQK